MHFLRHAMFLEFAISSFKMRKNSKIVPLSMKPLRSKQSMQGGPWGREQAVDQPDRSCRVWFLGRSAAVLSGGGSGHDSVFYLRRCVISGFSRRRLLFGLGLWMFVFLRNFLLFLESWQIHYYWHLTVFYSNCFFLLYSHRKSSQNSSLWLTLVATTLKSWSMKPCVSACRNTSICWAIVARRSLIGLS